jgi:hypothetical protein
MWVFNRTQQLSRPSCGPPASQSGCKSAAPGRRPAVPGRKVGEPRVARKGRAESMMWGRPACTEDCNMVIVGPPVLAQCLSLGSTALPSRAMCCAFPPHLTSFPPSFPPTVVEHSG